MTTILNASTSAGLIITPDTSGNIQLQYNGVAAPAFYYNQTGTATSVSNNTSTKIVYNNKIFDTANAVSNGRFQPTVAGYYYTTASIGWGPTTTSYYMECQLWKNGVQTTTSRTYTPYSLTTFPFAQGNFLVYLNGSTDYIEIYFIQGSGSTQTIQNGGDSDRTWWQGCMIRGA